MFFVWQRGMVFKNEKTSNPLNLCRKYGQREFKEKLVHKLLQANKKFKEGILFLNVYYDHSVKCFIHVNGCTVAHIEPLIIKVINQL